MSLVYMRQMPPNLIAFSSREGKNLFINALQQGTMECYFPLAEQFVTQLHPTTCGATTLVMVLNALKIDPEVQWKGIWRWYNEENLHGLKNEHLEKGIDLDEFKHIASHNKLAIQAFYHTSLFSQQYPARSQYNCQQQCQKLDQAFLTAKLSTFQYCIEAASRRNNFFMIINNSRKALSQTGEGHFTPIGGINLQSNMALLLDVARFKYPPYWCDIQQLYQSFEFVDQDTKMTRGFAILQKQHTYDSKDPFSSHQLKQKLDSDEVIQEKSLAILMVYYLFSIINRIEINKTQLQSEEFLQDLESASFIDSQLCIQAVQNQPDLYQLIQDFTFQYPDLNKCISILLCNVLKGHKFVQIQIQEEADFMRNILGI